MKRARSTFFVALLCCTLLGTVNSIYACLLPDGTKVSCVTSCVPAASIAPATVLATRSAPLGNTFLPQSLPSSAPPALRVRYDQASLDGPARKLFVDAIKDMKAAPKKGTEAGITNRYDEFVAMHGQACNHRNSGFLPWHRKLMWEFETEVRALNPTKYADFAIPYWDWTKNDFPSHLVNADADNNFMGPNGAGANNVVSDGEFKAGSWTTYEQVGGRNDLVRKFTEIEKLKLNGPAARDNMLSKNNFTEMSQISENGPELHNEAHTRVGGFFINGSGDFVPIGHLSDTDSGADDPVFWMLHGYIDMLWTRWQVSANGSLTAYTVFGGGPALDGNLRQFGNAANTLGFKDTINNTVRDQLDPFDTTKLGYRYDIVPEPTVGGIVALVSVLSMRRYRCAA